jgi:hypothetical protein
MASTLSSRIASARARRQSANRGTSTFADRIASARQRKGMAPDKDEEDRGFWDRLYYGEEEGKGGEMGLEEVPGQFLEVAASPIEKGVKPLVSLGAGVAKLPFSDDKDEDVRLAKTVGKQLYKSVAELPESIAGGYPAEGLMNVAAVPAMFLTGGAAALGGLSKVPKLGSLAKASESLTKLSRTPGMRAAAAVADPLTAASEGLKLARKAAPGVTARAREIGLPAIGAGAMERIVDPAKEIGQAAVEKITKKPKEAAEAARKFRKEMVKPGRKIRTQALEYMQGFLTDMPENAVTKLYDYVGDEGSYKTIMDASNSPKKALKEVHERLAAAIRQKQRMGREAYGKDRYSFFRGTKTEGAIPNSQETLPSDLRNPDTELPWRLNRVLNEKLSDGAEGFGARIVVKFYKEGKDGKRIYEGVDEKGKGVPDIREIDKYTQQDLQINPEQKYEYDVEFTSESGARSPLSDTERKIVRDHVKNNLLREGSPRLPMEDLLNVDKRFMDENPLKDRDLQVRDALVLRLHRAVTRSAESHLRKANKTKDANELNRIKRAYEAHKGEMNQIRATYGDAFESGVVTDASSSRLSNILRDVESTEDLERLISKSGIQKLLGVMSNRTFGGSLVVKSDFSKRMAAAGGIIGASGGLLVGAGTVGTLGASLAGVAALPLLAMYSPKMMLPISKRIADNPRFMRLVGRGPGAQKEAQKEASKLMRAMREAREVLGNETIQRFARQGMTVGQFMERIQQAQQREEQ